MKGNDIVSFDFGFLGNSWEKTAPYRCMVDHVSGAVFAVLTIKVVTDNMIKAMVASVVNWSRTDIILKSDGEPSCKRIQGRLRNARSAPTIVQNSLVGSLGSSGMVERMIQEVTGSSDA